MVDYVTDLERTPFVLSGRTVEALHLRVLGNIKDHIRIGLQGVDVKADGTAIVNLTPDQAIAVAKELTQLAHIAKRRII